jgi:hypothetical protein
MLSAEKSTFLNTQHKQQRCDRKTVPHAQARIHDGWKEGQNNEENHTRQIVIHHLTSPRIQVDPSNDKHYNSINEKIIIRVF